MDCATRQELSYIREYFYVGGHYAENGSGRHIFKDQMYVEQLTPVNGSRKPYPIVFIHGGGQTGTNWLNKPDGGPGWASYFISHGYTVYIIDKTYRGRSHCPPNSGSVLAYSAEDVQARFTAPALFNLWSQARLHTQWPGAGLMGDPIFDAYYASTVQSLVSKTVQQYSAQKAGAALLDRIGKPVILLGHSQGGIIAWLMADARPQFTKAIVNLEPSGPPFREGQKSPIGNKPARPYGLADIPMNYSPPVLDPKELAQQHVTPDSVDESPCFIQAHDPPARQLINLTDIPVLLLTAEASYHTTYDWGTIKFLRQAGVRNTEHLILSEKGVHGNGHLMFMEKNSDEIAGLVREWIEKQA